MSNSIGIKQQVKMAAKSIHVNELVAKSKRFDYISPKTSRQIEKLARRQLQWIEQTGR